MQVRRWFYVVRVTFVDRRISAPGFLFLVRQLVPLMFTHFDTAERDDAVETLSFGVRQAQGT